MRKGIILSLLAIGAVVGASVAPARALTPEEQRGFQFVSTNCSPCHAVGRYGDSPLAIAPPFRTLHENYPVEDLAEALAEGIVVGHPSMPQFQLDPDQVNDVIAYLKSLEAPAH